MADYNVHHTDINAPIIDVQGKRVDTTSLDVALFGKIRLEYGERLNEDLLNILENFACPQLEDSNPTVPDISQTTLNQLSNPTEGQIWYNSTNQTIYFWNSSEWVISELREANAANWGQIAHGEQLPKPVSPITGYTFQYNECIWSVAPANFVGKIGYVACATDANATVTMQYRLAGTDTIINGIANYLIIGLRGSASSTGPFPTPPAPSPTMSVTPTLTPTPTMTVTPSTTPAVTPTRSATPSPSQTPAPSLTPSVTGTPVVTPTPSRTPAVSPTRTPLPTPPASATPTPSAINRASWVMYNQRCIFYPNSEVIYGCPEEPNGWECQTAADVGKTEVTISDCYEGNGMRRCTRFYECRI